MPAASTRVVTTDKPYGEWDFPLPAGMDYFLNLSWQDENGIKADLSGYYVEMVLYFNGQPVLNLNTVDGDITVTTVANESDVLVHFPATPTRKLVLAPHQYFFRVQDAPPTGNQTTLFAGNANLIPS
jgi:hypothetical protein